MLFEFRIVERSIAYLAVFSLTVISSATLQPASLNAAPTYAQPGNGGVAQQELDSCLQIAKQGDMQLALEMAQKAHATYGAQRLFTVNYMNTLLTIIDENKSDRNSAVLNEVIRVVNEQRESQEHDGKKDPEVAFHFMNALGRLSAATMELNEKVSAKIRIYEGRIASNLKSNPGFPKNALETLASPMVSMAQGYAILHNQTQTFVALRKAADVGFGDFEMILNDPIINRLENKGAIEELVDDLQIRYQRAVADWSRTVLSEFEPYQFKFDVADIEGGRLRNADFVGKVIVLDMWATWCPPCRKGIPDFIKLQRNYGSKGVAVFGVAMDNPDDPYGALHTVKDFVVNHHMNYPCALGDHSFAKQVPGEQVLPTTVFIDQNNDVRYIARGVHDYAKLSAITRVLASESQPVRVGISSPAN